MATKSDNKRDGVARLNDKGKEHILAQWKLNEAIGAREGIRFYEMLAERLEKRELNPLQVASAWDKTLSDYTKGINIPIGLTKILVSEFDVVVSSIAGIEFANEAKAQLRMLNRQWFDQMMPLNPRLVNHDANHESATDLMRESPC